MGEVINITTHIDRLAATVQARRQHDQHVLEVKQSRKAADWQAIKTMRQEHAEFIRAMTSALGKPMVLRVITDAGETILDSRRYE